MKESVDIQTIWLNFQYIIMKECYAMLTMNIGTNLSYSRDKRRLFCSFLEVTQYPNNSYSLVCVQTKMLLW